MLSNRQHYRYFLVCFWESQPEDSSSIRIFISSGSILFFCNFHPIMSDSWGRFGPPYPQFYIQMVYKPHFETWILLKWIWVFLSNFWGCFFNFLLAKNKIIIIIKSLKRPQTKVTQNEVKKNLKKFWEEFFWGSK